MEEALIKDKLEEYFEKNSIDDLWKELKDRDKINEIFNRHSKKLDPLIEKYNKVKAQTKEYILNRTMPILNNTYEKLFTSNKEFKDVTSELDDVVKELRALDHISDCVSIGKFLDRLEPYMRKYIIIYKDDFKGGAKSHSSLWHQLYEMLLNKCKNEEQISYLAKLLEKENEGEQLEDTINYFISGRVLSLKIKDEFLKMV